MSENKKIRAIMVLDIIGRPAEHLVETLEKMINDLKQEKKVNVLSKDVKEPTILKDNKEFYTTFAEIEFEVESILYLTYVLFKYMPAHMDILSPENLSMTNNDLNEVVNELSRRLHTYDEIARVVQIEGQKLALRVKELEEKLEEKNSPSKKKKEKKK